LNPQGKSRNTLTINMKTKKIQLVISLASLAAVSSANAALAQIDGGMAVGGTGSFTDSSLTLNSPQFITYGTGDLSYLSLFAPLPVGTPTISGLSANPLSENIADYFVFASGTPGDNFEFTLTSLTETYYTTSYGGLADFSGTGTLVDADGTYAVTPASFTIGFSGPTSESFSFDTAPVPEPTTFIAGAAMLLPFGAGAFRMVRRMRKS
jgi:hypothetical protein